MKNEQQKKKKQRRGKGERKREYNLGDESKALLEFPTILYYMKHTHKHVLLYM